MPGKSTGARRRAPAPSALLLGAALVAGPWLMVDGARATAPPQPSAAQAFSPGPTLAGTPSDPAPDPPPPGAAALPPADPVRLRIPAIGVDSPVTRLGLSPGGTLTPPPADGPALAGWNGDGTAPGSAGTAVVVGHVDTSHGPGVFFGLGALGKGDTVEIARTDGRTAVFTVDAVEVYEKKDFPDDKVYGASGTPELRLITCGGSYSPSAGYSANTVVYASLTDVTG
ncbi:class F sortase [Kitasatospora sp. NE20-6]|uniref:class F sortase n=1 Tax=Kitasatospora sp. NE20-6 TaxID=2859066 RepID=UPI0034DC3842